MDKPIVFYDSGIGGIPYLTHLRDQIPQENFIYIADNTNFPYGEKPEGMLLEIIINIIKRIKDTFNPKIIVIACNTATVTALETLRTLIDTPLVGVVPAIKTAAEKTTNNKIGILATKRTVKGEYLKKLIQEFSADKEVYSVGASGIVEFVEDKYYEATQTEIDSFIAKSVTTLKEHSVDSVVLGCTHFIHVASEIKNVLGKNVLIIDSREGVTKQVLRVIPQKNKTKNNGTAQFFLTKELGNYQKYIKLCKNSKIEFKGAYYDK